MNIHCEKLVQSILHAVNHEVVPALGCTEPISLALASAIARQYLASFTRTY